MCRYSNRPLPSNMEPNQPNDRVMGHSDPTDVAAAHNDDEEEPPPPQNINGLINRLYNSDDMPTDTQLANVYNHNARPDLNLPFISLGAPALTQDFRLFEEIPLNQAAVSTTCARTISIWFCFCLTYALFIATGHPR